MSTQASTSTVLDGEKADAKVSVGRRRWPVVLLVALTLAGAGGFIAWRETLETYHAAAVVPGVLYRDGNRGLREFSNYVEQVRPKTVVCLIDDNELADPSKPQFKQELDYLTQHGIKIERVPVRLGGWPTESDVKRFLSVVADKQAQPVLVHCAQGVRRTGMMVAAYEQAVLGFDDARCKAAMLTFGHSQRTVGDVSRFIDGYDPATGAVPALADSEE